VPELLEAKPGHQAGVNQDEITAWRYRVGHATEVADGGRLMIRKLSSGEYRLYSTKKNPKTGKRRNLGTFKTRAAAMKHEREVQFFKRRG
jgi:hypothetical protein